MENVETERVWMEEALYHVMAFQRCRGMLNVTIAIDGMSAAGKTTLGNFLQEKLGGNLFHMDDFFLQPWQRTTQRLTEPGGNVDYERFKAEVIAGLRSAQEWQYGVYDCHKQCITRQILVQPEAVNIVEGSYSMHPFLGRYADVCFFLETKPEEQWLRIKTRNGERMLERFLREWIPKENDYFETYRIKEKCICLRTDTK